MRHEPQNLGNKNTVLSKLNRRSKTMTHGLPIVSPKVGVHGFSSWLGVAIFHEMYKGPDCQIYESVLFPALWKNEIPFRRS